MRRALWMTCLLVGCGGSRASSEPTDFEGQLEVLVEAHKVASITVGVMRGGRIVRTAAAGFADVPAGKRATPDTIYAIASCSKPVVGAAIAKLTDLDADLDLDADVNAWLEWSPPLRHPDHRDVPITLRHLATHRGGMQSDGPEDYESYPKPDPAPGTLEPMLRALLADPAYWTDHAPGETEVYSNLGTALAALVVERAAGQEFSALSRAHIFDPLGMNDTRWFFREFSAAQQARIALPHSDALEPFEHYGFEDYPSGQLRTTVSDLMRFMASLSGHGKALLSEEARALFHEVPLLIGDAGDTFEHSGGETGVNTFFSYDLDGNGYVYLVNSDLEDTELEALEDDLGDLLAPEAGMKE